MTRIRTNRKRRLGFEALEGRLALSAGMGIAAAAHHAHAVVMSRIQKAIPASFKANSQILNGTQFLATNLRGTIGHDHFTGSGTGTVAGTIFEGGTVSLSNSMGTIQLSLSPAIVVKVRKHIRQNVGVLITAATGKYAPEVGMTGLLNKWNTPAKPNAIATFGGSLNG
jgi:hypothetical protein